MAKLNHARRLTSAPPNARSGILSGIHWGAVLSLTLAVLLLMEGVRSFTPFGAKLWGQTEQCSNILGNGGFESATGWTVQSSGGYTAINDFFPRSGARSANLGGANGISDQLSTQVTLPTGQSRLELRLWWQVQSQEATDEFDGLTVLVADANGRVLKSLTTLGSANAIDAWQQAKLDLQEFAGQQIQLQFNAQTDNSLVTDFFIDDVEVVACTTASGEGTFRLFLPFTKR